MEQIKKDYSTWNKGPVSRGTANLFHVERAEMLFHVEQLPVRTRNAFETTEHSKRQRIRIGSTFERKSGLAEVLTKIN